MTNLLQRAAARVALRALNSDSNFTHDKASLKRTFGADVVKHIEEEVAAVKEANAIAQSHDGPDLTPEAATYWSEVLTLIERGKAVQAKSDREAERILFKECERQVERFDELVSGAERYKFKTYDAQRAAETYDPRWSYLDFDPPLLRDDFCNSYIVPNVRNYAQGIVLAAIAQPEPTQEERAKQAAATLEMFRLFRANEGLKQLEVIKRQEREAATVASRVKKVAADFKKAQKRAEREAAKMRKGSGSSQNAMKDHNEGRSEQ
ncbi:hypothetical protein N6H05_18870 [Sphingobium sp. WTD-1]|uniref:hypothetical protein n=1 Tax=Sphingobium sp. WTD-1 TaxID=2979467 RepID=UPI0024DEA462|nr:hypothetical protein [Sphingobium sp. WTD-1]WIA55080.1 hypothetical protein N6H05_18870 [Sphingobium sp. WTD-1]